MDLSLSGVKHTHMPVYTHKHTHTHTRLCGRRRKHRRPLESAYVRTHVLFQFYHGNKITKQEAIINFKMRAFGKGRGLFQLDRPVGEPEDPEAVSSH